MITRSRKKKRRRTQKESVTDKQVPIKPSQGNTNPASLLEDNMEEETLSGTSDDRDKHEDDNLNNYKSVPIMVKTEGITHDNLIKIIKSFKITVPNAMLKHARDNITIYPCSRLEHAQAKAYLEERKIQHYTYTQQEDKVKKFVIKGLPKLDQAEIITDLQRQNVHPIKRVQMKSNTGTEQMYTFYFLSVRAETEAKDIYSIRHIDPYIVRIKRYYNSRLITQ